MKTVWIAALALLPSLCLAQPEKRYAGQGYLSVAPGVATPGGTAMLHMAIGGEGLLYRGLGAGAEIGALGPARYLSCSIGVLSANAYYSFLEPLGGRKIVPFATAGYSLLFRAGRANAVNFGAGVNYWFAERAGLRFELRDHYSPGCCNAHFTDFRFGFAFR